MKPGEEPGRVHNYQSWGMNVLTHALATIYGLYDIADSEGSPGFAVLIREKLAEPTGVSFGYSSTNPPFGYRLPYPS
ncbi:MAG: hypothetical protein GF331_16850 [Chitinivibrionales bacterium]|nr:hypothetical protein [Chitinivibrionales bacterium]